MIDYLARQNSDALVIGWALATCGLMLVAAGIAAVAMLMAVPLLGLLSAALVLASWVPTALLISAAKRQEKMLR